MSTYSLQYYSLLCSKIVAEDMTNTQKQSASRQYFWYKAANYTAKSPVAWFTGQTKVNELMEGRREGATVVAGRTDTVS